MDGLLPILRVHVGQRHLRPHAWCDTLRDFDTVKISKMAISKPLVDVVNQNQVVTNAMLVKEVDLHTVRIEDLAFESQFSLTCHRNDCIRAMVTFFIVQFSKCQKRMGFSTAPDDDSTRWKQTVFFLENALTVKKGEVINGLFAINSKYNNCRDLDFKISISYHGKLCDSVESSNYQMD